MSDLADILDNAVIKPERGNRWRFVAASKFCRAIATELSMLSDLATRAYSEAHDTSTFGKDISICYSSGCCGCIVALESVDFMPRPVWWKVSYFFDRDGREANVFVWSAPERQFFRRSIDWFNCRVG